MGWPCNETGSEKLDQKVETKTIGKKQGTTTDDVTKIGGRDRFRREEERTELKIPIGES